MTRPADPAPATGGLLGGDEISLVAAAVLGKAVLDVGDWQPTGPLEDDNGKVGYAAILMHELVKAGWVVVPLAAPPPRAAREGEAERLLRALMEAAFNGDRYITHNGIPMDAPAGVRRTVNKAHAFLDASGEPEE